MDLTWSMPCLLQPPKSSLRAALSKTQRTEELMQIRYRKITCSCLDISGEVLFLVPDIQIVFSTLGYIATLSIYEIILF